MDNRVLSTTTPPTHSHSVDKYTFLLGVNTMTPALGNSKDGQMPKGNSLHTAGPPRFDMTCMSPVQKVMATAPAENGSVEKIPIHIFKKCLSWIDLNAHSERSPGLHK